MTRWYRRVRLAFGAVWFATALWAASHWRSPNSTPAVASDAQRQLTRRARQPESDSAFAVLDEFLARMPFDESNGPGGQPETSSAAIDSVAPTVHSAQLLLTGIVDGAVRLAIIDGIPGMDGGKALRLGEQLGPVRLIDVRGQSAVLDIAGARTVLVIGKPASVSP